MVTSATRSLLQAALAAVFILVSGCGGGGDEPSLPAAKTPTTLFSGTPVQGTTFDGQPRRTALAAPPQAPPPVFDITVNPVDTALTATAVVRAEAAALAAANAPSEERINTLLDWAERAYPDLFPTHESNLTAAVGTDTYRYRFYKTTGNYVGVQIAGSDVSGVYGYGSFVVNVMTSYGHVDDYNCFTDPTSCGPKLVSATLTPKVGKGIPAAGALNVPAKGTTLTFTYDQVLNCAGVSGRRLIGNLTVLVTCSGQSISFLPGNTGEERWPFSSENVVTAGGLPGATGFPSAPVTVRFTTAKVAGGARVYTGNAGGNFVTKAGGSIIDVATGSVQSVHFGDELGGYQFVNGKMAMSQEAGIVYVAPYLSQFIYRLDMETGRMIRPFQIQVPAVDNQVPRGVAVSDTLVCATLGIPGFVPYVYASHGKMVCFNQWTNERIDTPAHFATGGDTTLVPDKLHYSAARRRFYSLNWTTLALETEEIFGGKLRDGFKRGTRGTVTEIDCETVAGKCSVTNTFVVGSVPQGVTEDVAKGLLYVANSGDDTISVISLSTGKVDTRALPGFGGLRHPMRLLLDPVNNWLLVSDYENRIVVYNPTPTPTMFVELRSVVLPDMPMDMTYLGNELWVTLPVKGHYAGEGTAVTVLDRSTLVVKKTINGVGPSPWAILAYD